MSAELLKIVSISDFKSLPKAVFTDLQTCKKYITVNMNQMLVYWGFHCILV